MEVLDREGAPGGVSAKFTRSVFDFQGFEGFLTLKICRISSIHRWPFSLWWIGLSLSPRTASLSQNPQGGRGGGGLLGCLLGAERAGGSRSDWSAHH